MYETTNKIRGYRGVAIDFTFTLGKKSTLNELYWYKFADMYGTGEGMHLDHKIPMSWFDIDNADHNKVCQHQTNLQWLTPEENLTKKNFYADVNGQKVLRKDFDLEAYVRNMLKKLA